MNMSIIIGVVTVSIGIGFFIGWKSHSSRYPDALESHRTAKWVNKIFRTKQGYMEGVGNYLWISLDGGITWNKRV